MTPSHPSSISILLTFPLSPSSPFLPPSPLSPSPSLPPSLSPPSLPLFLPLFLLSLFPSLLSSLSLSSLSLSLPSFSHLVCLHLLPSNYQRINESELEQELGITNTLHRLKLRLACPGDTHSHHQC